MPTASLIALANGARQFVVHDALEMTWCFSLSYWSSLTPSTSVMSSFFAGAEMMTLETSPVMWALAFSASVKKPVDSMTTCAPTDAQSMFPGSRSAKILISLPSTTMPSPVASTVPGYGPSSESYLTRWASVFGSVRSLTATNSMSAPDALAARKTLRPMRPKPLMPTRTVMKPSFWSSRGCDAGNDAGPPRRPSHRETWEDV